MTPSTGAAVRLHRNAVRHRPDSLSAFKWKACPPSPESASFETKGFYETRVMETDDPVNHRWVNGKLVPVNPNCKSCGVDLKSDPPQDDEFTCWCHQCNVKRTAQPPTQQSLAL